MITDLRVQHFRSYFDASFELAESVNIIVGPNASGKTNLLEAILVLAKGKSYRARDEELVQHQAAWARIDGHLSNDSVRTVKIVTEPTLTKSYQINDKLYKRLTHRSTIPSVLFEPNHLQLLSGSPEGRRNYLDDLIDSTTAGFGSTRREYRRALAQRNSLLKQNQATHQQIFPWNVRLSQLAGQIVRLRQKFASDIDGQISTLYRDLSRTKTLVSVSYQSSWPVEAYESNLLKQLEKSLELDKLRGFTSNGPHREDLSVLFDGRLAAETASRGEIRTAILALKIIELKLVQAARDITPLLLLDDVFSELDGKRRHALTDYLAPYQTFITTTDADLVVKHFTARSSVIALG